MTHNCLPTRVFRSLLSQCGSLTFSFMDATTFGVIVAFGWTLLGRGSTMRSIIIISLSIALALLRL
jgi:hypothetical protein